MQTISINLLPEEFTKKELVKKKFYKIQSLSMAALIVLIFVGSLAISLRILQNQSIASAKTQLTQTENRVSALKGKEGAVVILKNRTDTISRVKENPSKQLLSYSLINNLLPADVSVSSLTIDQIGDITISIATSNQALLDSFLSDLTTNQKNFNLVERVNLDSISRSKDAIYRTTLKIKIR